MLPRTTLMHTSMTAHPGKTFSNPFDVVRLVFPSFFVYYFFIMATLNVSTLFVSPPPPRRVLSTNHNQAAASLTVCRLIRKSSEDFYVPGLNVLMGSGLRGRVCMVWKSHFLSRCIYVCVVSVLMYYCMYLYLYLYFVLFFILKIQPTNIFLLLIIQYADGWTYKQTDRRTGMHICDNATSNLHTYDMYPYLYAFKWLRREHWEIFMCQ